MHRVFVFGTLKRGFANHDEGLAGQTCLGPHRTACAYPLVIAGPWFTPMMMPEPGLGNVVTGELYEVDDATLAVLDRIVAVHRPDGYRRLSIEIISCTDGSKTSAWAYFRDRSHIGEVPFGVPPGVHRPALHPSLATAVSVKGSQGAKNLESGLPCKRTMTLLIFDCDGVLVDSEPVACAVDAKVLTGLGFAYTPEGIASRFVGTSLKDMIRQIEADHGRTLPADFGEQVSRMLLARFESDLKPISGVREAILALPYPCCVASSSTPVRIALSLRVTGLGSLFERTFSAVEVQLGKPAPDLFLHAAAQTGAPPECCPVIEDSIFGVLAARAAGMRVIGFTGGGHCGPAHSQALMDAGATAIVAHMRDLPAAVERLLA